MNAAKKEIKQLEMRFFSLGKTVQEFYEGNQQNSLFNEGIIFDREFLEKLYTPFSDWSEEEIVEVMKQYMNLKKNFDITIPIRNIAKWLKNHTNDSRSVTNCMNIIPPSRYEIIRQLPQTGKQKLVFLSYEQFSHRQKILKKIINTTGSDSIINNELKSTTVKHPNIIETHFKQNPKQEDFFIEDVLKVLNDDSECSGILDAVNVMFDIVSALDVLHNNDIVHLDIKPDNIAMDRERYVLLDFGVCRSVKGGDPSLENATGSFRTRAPELFVTGKYEDHRKADIFSLAATVYRLLLKKFPLIENNERFYQNDEDKETISKNVVARIENYDSYVFNDAFNKLDFRVKDILKRALNPKPEARCDVEALEKELQRHFASHIRKDVFNLKLTPLEEFDQILKAIDNKPATINLIPIFEREKIKEKLREIATILLAEKNLIDRELRAKLHNYLELFAINIKDIED
jgi:serine/threonine protein kinase